MEKFPAFFVVSTLLIFGILYGCKEQKIRDDDKIQIKYDR